MQKHILYVYQASFYTSDESTYQLDALDTTVAAWRVVASKYVFEEQVVK